MINKWIGMGRICRDPELMETNNGTPYVNFTLAIERSYTDKDGERQADFINCVAWRQVAEFICTWFGKGSMIAVEGELQSRTYDDKNGVTHYVTEALIHQASFTGEKAGQSRGADAPRTPPVEDVEEESERRYSKSKSAGKGKSSGKKTYQYEGRF